MTPRKALNRWLLLFVGLVVPQFVLYAPSFLGIRCLLPLDLLRARHHDLPGELPEAVGYFNSCSMDVATHNEPERMFMAAEYRAARIPLWNPYLYGGSPAAVWPKFAPHSLIYTLFPSPHTIVWLQLLKSVLAGLGAYLFFSQVLKVGYWPAAFGSWALPLTGYSILWQGILFSWSYACLPWLCLAADRLVRAPTSWWGPLLAILTACMIHSGALNVTGLILLACGLFGLWQAVTLHLPANRVRALQALVALSLSWTLGLVMSFPYILPLLEYMRTGAQFASRAKGAEPFPPNTLDVSLPQTLLPRSQGPFDPGYLQLFDGNYFESAASAYAGLLATLWFAPLAFGSQQHRGMTWFSVFAIVLGLAWQLQIPVLLPILRNLPVISVLPWSRFTFFSSFGLVTLSVIGLEVLTQELSPRKLLRWYVPILSSLILSGLLLWCVARALFLVEPLASQIDQVLTAGRPFQGIPNRDVLFHVKADFMLYHLVAAGFCGLGLIGWYVTYFHPGWRRQVGVLGLLWGIELLWAGFGRAPQADPALYYPRIPLFDYLDQGTPGRILGFNCFPPDYCVTQKLKDIRGYDGMDPAKVVDLLDLVRHPHNPRIQTQWFVPNKSQFFTEAGLVRVPPVLSMMHVRYLLFRSDTGPDFPGSIPIGEDYWVYENREAVPRVYVPNEVIALDGARAVFDAVAQHDFRPRDQAFVELPSQGASACRGSAQIVDENPNRVVVEYNMDTAGYVLLVDRWDAGWRVYRDDQPLPLVKMNYAFRGVHVRAGTGTLVFQYEPSSFAFGVKCFFGALSACGLWTLLLIRWSTPPTFNSPRPPSPVR